MHDFIQYLLTGLQNRFVYIPLLAVLVAQILKLIIHGIMEKKINFELITSTGAMPSSHSSMVSALATIIGLENGFNSAIFGLAASFAIIVIYDATGLRRAVGRQASILNHIVDDLLVDHHLQGKRLKELIGHTPLQVWAGICLGVAIGLLFY